MHIARNEFVLISNCICNTVFDDFHLFDKVVLMLLNKILYNENMYRVI